MYTKKSVDDLSNAYTRIEKFICIRTWYRGYIKKIDGKTTRDTNASQDQKHDPEPLPAERHEKCFLL